VTEDFLQEISNGKIVVQKGLATIIPCLGISRDPETGNYIMVIIYSSEGDLKKFLLKNFSELNFRDKIKQLALIANTLLKIHSQGLVHKDFHSGNILIREDKGVFSPFVTDLGLSRPANENVQEKIYGVLPYVAPEVLQNKPYTQASDIYSFGIIVYELLANAYPYPKMDDTNLALKVCQGHRPDIDKVPVPQLLKDLIKKCWDADPEKRPNAEELVALIGSWLENKTIEKEEEYNCFSKSTPYQMHPMTVTTSKPINTKLITEQLQKLQDSRQLDLTLDLTQLNLSEDNQEQSSLQFQQEILPK